MKISSLILALVVLFFSLPVFAGENQEKLIVFAGGATLTPPSGVSIPPRKQDDWLRYCDVFEYIWTLDVGPYAELYTQHPEWSVQGVQCITSIEVATSKKEVPPTTRADHAE